VLKPVKMCKNMHFADFFNFTTYQYFSSISDMKTRREILQLSAAGLITAAVPGCSSMIKKQTLSEEKRKIKKAAVIWFSQTGHTERIGRIISDVLKKENITVIHGDYRFIDKKNIEDADLVIAGSPVYYMEVPHYYSQWLKKLNIKKGIPCAGYSTFGGPGDNQHNTAYELCEILQARGGIPMALETLGNMSTFAPTWSMGNEARILKYKHKPNEKIYDQARNFGKSLLKMIKEGTGMKLEEEFTFANFIGGGISRGGTKLMITGHSFDKEKCISCGICEKYCPVGAIDHSAQKVDTSKCAACMGCVNKCPQNAIKMNFLGKKVYGFPQFLKKHKIEIKEPEL
jgi:ferredoxin/flavodoxin